MGATVSFSGDATFSALEILHPAPKLCHAENAGRDSLLHTVKYSLCRAVPGQVPGCGTQLVRGLAAGGGCRERLHGPRNEETVKARRTPCYIQLIWCELGVKQPTEATVLNLHA